MVESIRKVKMSRFVNARSDEVRASQNPICGSALLMQTSTSHLNNKLGFCILEYHV